MRYVTCMGGLWRLGERAYRRMLKDMVRGCVEDLNAYGKRLGDAENVTDLHADEAEDILRDLGCRIPKHPPTGD